MLWRISILFLIRAILKIKFENSLDVFSKNDILEEIVKEEVGYGRN